MSDNSFAHKEAFWILCDKQIGRGMGRTVYSSLVLPDSVVKVEDDARHFQNIVEWETWQRVKDTEFSRWFAECKWISPTGAVLVMERTRPAAPSEIPERMPVFLSDFKHSNYGMAKSSTKDGKPGKEWFVCHDYGTNLLFENGLTKRMRKVEWWNV